MGVSIYTLQTEEATWSAKGKQSGGIMFAEYTSQLCISYNCHLLVNGRCLHFEAHVVDGF